jgi:hypothetical protein
MMRQIMARTRWRDVFVDDTMVYIVNLFDD